MTDPSKLFPVPRAAVLLDVFKYAAVLLIGYCLAAGVGNFVLDKPGSSVGLFITSASAFFVVAYNTREDFKRHRTVIAALNLISAHAAGSSDTPAEDTED